MLPKQKRHRLIGWFSVGVNILAVIVLLIATVWHLQLTTLGIKLNVPMICMNFFIIAACICAGTVSYRVLKRLPKR